VRVVMIKGADERNPEVDSKDEVMRDRRNDP